MKHTFISRVTIRNTRALLLVQVELGALMFLVGPNGSGKSNFLDAYVSLPMLSEVGWITLYVIAALSRRCAAVPEGTRTTLLCVSISIFPPVKVDLFLQSRR